MTEKELNSFETTRPDDDHDGEVEPYISNHDSFSVSGRDLNFDDFVEAIMDGIPEQVPVDVQPQPSPQPWDIVWAARRPSKSTNGDTNG